MVGLIYKITNPSNRIYIGQTINSYKRFNRYKNKLCKGQIKLYRSLCVYGFENHTIDIIKENIPIEELDNLENYYIALFGCANTGLNCAKFAGSTMRGRNHSQETKDKQRNSNIGQTRSENSKKKMANAKLGKPGNNLGKSMSIETKDKIQNTRSLRKHFYKFRTRKLSIDQIKEIKRLLQEGNLLQKQIAKIYNVTPETISGIKCNNTWKTITI